MITTDDDQELGAKRFQHWLDTGEDDLPAIVPPRGGLDEPVHFEGQLSLLDEPSDAGAGASIASPKESPGDVGASPGMAPTGRSGDAREG